LKYLSAVQLMTITTVCQNRPATDRTRLPGLDLLRLLAAILVFSQHAASNCHHDELIDIGGVRIGRIGTALFFLLSGFLSASTSRPPLTWLRDRLVFLFPPYWIVTAVGFLMAWATATKEFGPGQVISQFAGTGYLTHGSHIVNISTWFMSPLLLMYAGATVCRMGSTRWTLPVLTAALVLMALIRTTDAATLFCHGVTYFLAFGLASLPAPRRRHAAVFMCIALAVAALFQTEFRYGAMASLLFVLALPVRSEWRPAQRFTGVAYEWFLVHGLSLAIVSHLTSSYVMIVLAGALLSVVSALTLKQMVKWLSGGLAPFRTENRLQRQAVSETESRPPSVSATSLTSAEGLAPVIRS
jgi:peptidoglycan/LPS O-acetylase OafA/YrhL